MEKAKNKEWYTYLSYITRKIKNLEYIAKGIRYHRTVQISQSLNVKNDSFKDKTSLKATSICYLLKVADRGFKIRRVFKYDQSLQY